VKIRVYYEDTDAGGIVYHANYIKYCERARSEILFRHGMTPLDNQTGLIVRDLKATFHASAVLGDLLEVTTEVIEVKKVTIRLRQCVYKDNKLLFEMEIYLANFVDGRLRRIRDDLVTLLDDSGTHP
jgi:acyl-CoA thioester hydrolase